MQAPRRSKRLSKASSKRVLSPHSSPTAAEKTPKKLKSTDGTYSETYPSDLSILPESKLFEPLPTAGNDECKTTKASVLVDAIQSVEEHIKPSSKSQNNASLEVPTTRNADIPTWAKDFYPILNAIKKELCWIRNEISEIRQWGGTNPTASAKLSNKPSDVPVPPKTNAEHNLEEMDIEHPDLPNDEIPSDLNQHQPKQPPHANYLHDCFQSRIGLDPRARVKVDITSFDGVLVARGYNRIVPTWQGYFVELEEEDILFDNLTWNDHPAVGEESWLSPGLKIFLRTQPDKRRSPRPRRFAIKTPSDFTDYCNPLLANKYYLHAYQARFVVGNLPKSLNSRSMAYSLSQQHPNTYHPRRNDLPVTRNQRPNQPNPTSTQTQTQAANKVPQPLLPTVPPQIIPTPFVPIQNCNQPFLPAGLQFPALYPRPNSSLQQPTVPAPTPQLFPLVNQQFQQHSNFKPPVSVAPALQNQAPVPTYAQIANPWYNSTYLQSQQQLNLQSNNNNHHYRRNARQTIPVSS